MNKEEKATIVIVSMTLIVAVAFGYWLGQILRMIMMVTGL